MFNNSPYLGTVLGEPGAHAMGGPQKQTRSLASQLQVPDLPAYGWSAEGAGAPLRNTLLPLLLPGWFS